MNSYFIVKIAAIVASFTLVNYDELIFLKYLIPKPKNKFILPSISIDETEDIITKTKNSTSRGYNYTNMRFIKLNPKAFAAFITTRKTQLPDGSCHYLVPVESWNTGLQLV